MSILPQYHSLLSLKCQHYAPGYHSRFLSSPPRIYCSATTTTTAATGAKLRQQDRPVIEPQLLNQPRPLGKNAVLGGDPDMQSTWSHRAWVASGCTTVLISLAKAVTGSVDSHIWVQPILAGLVGYLLADLGSGVYHWGIDNYGGAGTPIFGSQIDAFQGHHKWPWTITRRQFANNLHALARAVTIAVLPIDLICNDPVLNGFVAVCSGCIMFSQQFHAWAHGTKSKLPSMVVALQDFGILVSRRQHSAHHRPPYNNNYCIVSGVWNEFVDKNKVFESMEMILFFKFRVRPRSWSEPNSDWVEESEA